jgi:hypothetical protein
MHLTVLALLAGTACNSTVVYMDEIEKTGAFTNKNTIVMSKACEGRIESDHVCKIFYAAMEDTVCARELHKILKEQREEKALND